MISNMTKSRPATFDIESVMVDPQGLELEMLETPLINPNTIVPHGDSGRFQSCRCAERKCFPKGNEPSTETFDHKHSHPGPAV